MKDIWPRDDPEFKFDFHFENGFISGVRPYSFNVTIIFRIKDNLKVQENRFIGRGWGCTVDPTDSRPIWSICGGTGTESCGLGNVFPSDDLWIGLDTYTNCILICDLLL